MDTNSRFKRELYKLYPSKLYWLGTSNELGDGTLSAEVVEKFAESAKFVVMLTGTPYRSDNRELIFAEYTQQDEYGTRRLLADVEADYLEGVREGYLRPMEALVFDGTIQVEDLTAGRKDEATISENNVALVPSQYSFDGYNLYNSRLKREFVSIISTLTGY